MKTGELLIVQVTGVMFLSEMSYNSFSRSRFGFTSLLGTSTTSNLLQMFVVQFQSPLTVVMLHYCV